MAGPRIPRRRLLFVIAASVAMTGAGAAQDTARQRGSQRVADGPLLTVRTPQQEQFELSLQELELEPADSSRSPAATRSLRLPSSFSSVATRDGRSILRVGGASSAQDLLRLSRDLETANPGRRVNWILYRPEVDKTLASRVLLTHEVGLILEDNVSHDEVLSSAGGSARAVPAVPNAYVIDAGDPLSALSLVETLRQRPGVRAAYSLIKRQLSPR